MIALPWRQSCARPVSDIAHRFSSRLCISATLLDGRAGNDFRMLVMSRIRQRRLSLNHLAIYGFAASRQAEHDCPAPQD